MNQISFVANKDDYVPRQYLAFAENINPFFLFRVVMGLAADGPIKSLLYYLLFVLLWIGKVIDRGD